MTYYWPGLVPEYGEKDFFTVLFASMSEAIRALLLVLFQVGFQFLNPGAQSESSRVRDEATTFKSSGHPIASLMWLAIKFIAISVTGVQFIALNLKDINGEAGYPMPFYFYRPGSSPRGWDRS